MVRIIRHAALLLLPLAAVQAQPQAADESETELEPIIVEAKRDPLDAIGAARERLPCIGDCDAGQDEPGALSRFWRGLVELSIYGPPAQEPEPMQSLGVVNPIKARLDDKQP